LSVSYPTDEKERAASKATFTRHVAQRDENKLSAQWLIPQSQMTYTNVENVSVRLCAA
jgi:hypothetical protein